jgi:hypothetical protein
VISGKARTGERNPRQTAVNVEKAATEIANKTPKETKTPREYDREEVTTHGKPES